MIWYVPRLRRPVSHLGSLAPYPPLVRDGEEPHDLIPRAYVKGAQVSDLWRNVPVCKRLLPKSRRVLLGILILDERLVSVNSYIAHKPSYPVVLHCKHVRL
jgi:hypothetical protein